MSQKIKIPEITAEKNKVNGSWVISTIYKNFLVTRTYYGFTKREAISEFKQALKEL